jgi:hypothetical protein
MEGSHHNIFSGIRPILIVTEENQYKISVMMAVTWPELKPGPFT